ncbi:uncharacterized protein LOC127701353 [Mytilus californianus]|uniref:uncharacterized protein LOC127701353 n=1 Tax=Mytilus californianus TaxID=6549 RepID=UPI0022473BD8|nr:uncharacterized protein LOC127701353 [Mytilus californianus]
MGTQANIKLEFTDDGITIIRMLNGENRLNNSFLQEFNNTLDLVLENKDCKALITTSEGKFYSNGIDLKWMTPLTDEKRDQFRASLADSIWRIMHFPIPTVAALNGHTFAGGAFLAMGHDYRVMRSDRGWICWNEVHMNLPIKEDIRDVINNKIWNVDAHREAIVFGRRITAPEAKTLGLVDSVVDIENLLQEAKRLAKHALGNNNIDREALAMMKRNTYTRQVYASKL